jgi:hypothetical protein
MKLHLCCLNWSQWSDTVQGYAEKRQYRKCLVCNLIESRNSCGYDEQIKANTANEAVKSISLEEKK